MVQVTAKVRGLVRFPKEIITWWTEEYSAKWGKAATLKCAIRLCDHCDVDTFVADYKGDTYEVEERADRAEFYIARAVHSLHRRTNGERIAFAAVDESAEIVKSVLGPTTEDILGPAIEEFLNENRYPETAVPCRHCDAKAGERCRSAQGKALPKSHVDRRVSFDHEREAGNV